MNKTSMRSIGLLALLALIWGSSFILMKWAMFDGDGGAIFSSAQVASLRIFFAGAFLIPWGYRHLRDLVGPKGLFLIISGVVGSTIPAFLFTAAQQHINSSLAGMLNALTPLFTFFLGVLIFKVPFRRSGLIGVLIGLVGAMGLIYFGSETSLGLNIWASLLVLATACYGFNINVIKTYLGGMSSMRISALSLMFVMPFAGAYAYFDGALDVFYNHPRGELATGYIILLALFGTAIGLILFNVLIKEVSALFASSVTYFIPVAAIGWGMWDGETVSLTQLGCIGLILLGVWYVNRRKAAHS